MGSTCSLLLIVIFLHNSLTFASSSSPTVSSIFTDRGAWIDENSAPIVSEGQVKEDVEVLMDLTLLFLLDLRGTFAVIIFGKSAMPASVFLCAIILSFSGFRGSCSGCRGLRYLLCLVVRLLSLS